LRSQGLGSAEHVEGPDGDLTQLVRRYDRVDEAVSVEILRSLHAGGQSLAGQRALHTWAEQADQRARLGRCDVPE
jgi:hypothetical protein